MFIGRVRNCTTVVVALGVMFCSRSVLAIAPYGSFTGESKIDPGVMQIDEPSYLGTPLQKDFSLIDNRGRTFTLGEMFGKPLLLLFSYYGCGGSCPVMNRELKEVIGDLERFKIGEDFRVLTVSFDTLDSPESMNKFVSELGISKEWENTAWRHAILENSNTDIDRLTNSVGYKSFWSPADDVFLHPNAVLFVTPEGRVARYLYGTAMNVKEVELALIDADWGRIANSSNVIDILSGVCFSYNFAEGKYTLNISLFAGVAALLFGITLIVLAASIFYRKRVLFQRRMSNV